MGKVIISFDEATLASINNLAGKLDSFATAIVTEAAQDDSPDPAEPKEKPPAKSKPSGKSKAKGKPAAKEPPTLEELRSALKSYMDEHGKPAAVDLLSNHGVTSLSDCPEDKFAALAADLGLAS